MAFDLSDEELKATREMPCNKHRFTFSTEKKGETENDRLEKSTQETKNK